MRGFVVFVVLALSLMLSGSNAMAVDKSSQAEVSDGDSFRIGRQAIRLHGIDAPELKQSCRNGKGRDWSCGQWARAQLHVIVRGKRLTCKARDTDRYGRIVATCHADGQDIAALMVERGAAVAFTRYSRAYLPHQASARAAGAGIWAGPFELPDDWRAARNSREVAAAAPTGRCEIKGNISGDRRIYHMPGQKHYAETVISPAKGERWFCSEAEAQAAGWRRARQ